MALLPGKKFGTASDKASFIIQMAAVKVVAVFYLCYT
jgi:hypothetical protein